ncbi:MAG: type II toxin-antitoxin system VapC family toxin [Gemmatimonadota bacterium]|nr:type II toxin-antitoxin system VapC family toxin [Gemmatimonadota bacterium]
MILLDVNILVYAFRTDSPRHAEYHAWLQERLRGREPVGCSDVVLSGVLRVLTHPRVFDPPTPVSVALEYVNFLRNSSNHVAIAPGPRHWEIFSELCSAINAKGNTVPDAYLAALAIEHGCEWITADRGFARYRGLRWRHPLE